MDCSHLQIVILLHTCMSKTGPPGTKFLGVKNSDHSGHLLPRSDPGWTGELDKSSKEKGLQCLFKEWKWCVPFTGVTMEHSQALLKGGGTGHLLWPFLPAELQQKVEWGRVN